MGKLTFLADPDADLKAFSQFIVLSTIFFTEPTTFENLQQNLKNVYDKFDQILQNYVLFFGSDHDPHRPGSITLEQFISDNIEFRYLEVIESSKGRLLLLTGRGKELLLENIGFFGDYIKVNRRK